MSQSIRRALYRAKGLPDPGPTPSVAQTQLTILVERPLVEAIDGLHALVEKHFESRNDFLVELLNEGLRSAAQAATEAAAALAAQQEQEARPAIEIVNPALAAGEAERISARLRALRGEGLAGPSAVERGHA